jgi:hypothetical protein
MEAGLAVPLPPMAAKLMDTVAGKRVSQVAVAV